MRPTYRTSFAPESDRRNHTMFFDAGHCARFRLVPIVARVDKPLSEEAAGAWWCLWGKRDAVAVFWELRAVGFGRLPCSTACPGAALSVGVSGFCGAYGCLFEMQRNQAQICGVPGLIVSSGFRWTI